MSLDMVVWIKQELKYENNPIKVFGEICRTAPENMVDFCLTQF